MDSQRLEDIACMLALLMLPAACSDDSATDESTGAGSTGDSTSAPEGTTADSAEGGTTSADTMTADATSEASASVSSTGVDDSSSAATTSDGTADETSDATAETGGEVGPLCQAWAENAETCFPDRVDPVEVGELCEMAFVEYAVYGQACLDAAEAFYMCRAEATCQELERDACFPFLNMVVEECG